MAKRSKAGKGGGQELAKLSDIVAEVGSKIDAASSQLDVRIDTKAFNSFTQKMKVEITKSNAIVGGILQTELSKIIDNNTSNNIWEWPRFTNRKNGTQVTSPRNIVDTGALLSKNKVTVQYNVRGFKLIASNSSPYASIQHYGGYVGGNLSGKRGTYMPPRPWLDFSLGITVGGARPPGGIQVLNYKEALEKATAEAIRKAAAGG